MAQHNEIEFERELAEYLADHDWLYSSNDAGYDRERALFPEDVFAWLVATQPEQLEKVVKPGSKDIDKQQSQVTPRWTTVAARSTCCVRVFRIWRRSFRCACSSPNRP